MMSATCLSRSSSWTVDGTELPTEARTRDDTTEDSVDLDIRSSDGRSESSLAVSSWRGNWTLVLVLAKFGKGSLTRTG